MSCNGHECEYQLEHNTILCPQCKSYVRKIEEIEIIKSGRDAVIDALQNQLKKWETNYKNLFDKFENLRFEHSTATHQNFSLKEINAKFKDQLFKIEKKTDKSKEPELCNKCIQEGDCEQEATSLTRQDKEVLTPKHLFEFKTVESGDYLHQKPQIKELTNSADQFIQLSETNKQENQYMKNLLNQKENNLSNCVCLVDCSTYNDTMDSRSDHINYSKDLDIPSSPRRMETQKSLTLCKCSVLNHLNDVTNNNHKLSETLDIITAENKSNFQAVIQLKEELRRLNEECDFKCDNLKQHLYQTENELDSYRLREKKLKSTIQLLNRDTECMARQLEKLMEENSHLTGCRCSADVSQIDKISELELTIKDMRAELMQKVFQLSQFDEEHNDLCRKIDILIAHNTDLSAQVKKLEGQLQEATKEPNRNTISTQMSTTFNDLEKETSRMREENQNLQKDIRRSNDLASTKTKEVEELQNSIRSQLDEMHTINEENENLKDEIERIKKENDAETARLQNLVEHSQQQVTLLLEEHDEKTKQIQSVANELDNIRKSVSEENNTFIEKIRELEEENQKLGEELKQHEGMDCHCEGGREEIERLQAELARKQCTIAELESSMDNFNQTMEQFEEDLKKMVSENESLKKERTDHINTIQDIRQQLEKATNQSNSMNSRLNQAEMTLEQCSKEKKILQEENENLKKQLMKVQAEKDLELREVEAEKLQMEMEIVQANENRKRQSIVSTERLQSLQTAYDELKTQFETKVSENEALSKENVRLQQLATNEKNHNDSFLHDIESLQNLKRSHEELKRIYAAKCIESEELRHQFDETKKQSNLAQKENSSLRSSLEENKAEFQKNYDLKCGELKKLKKQCDSTSKQCQISREEYNNLRKEYKEIKSMLSEQIKKCRQDINTSDVHSKKEKKCVMIEVMTQRLKEKENETRALQQKLQDSSYEIIELKDYIHKLTSDNNILKSAINNLINNLERKIKGPSPVQGNSVELIAGEILSSLTNIETSIVKKCNTCPTKECNCMVEICSQYNMYEPGPSKLANRQKSLKECPEEPCCVCPESNKNTTRTATESSTTDSDDCHCLNFLDSTSVNFLKETIQELKMRKDSTMKEKSCDCEQITLKNL